MDGLAPSKVVHGLRVPENCGGARVSRLRTLRLRTLSRLPTLRFLIMIGLGRLTVTACGHRSGRTVRRAAGFSSSDLKLRISWLPIRCRTSRRAARPVKEESRRCEHGRRETAAADGGGRPPERH